MKEAKRFFVLILSILTFLLLLPFEIIVLIIKILESILKITKNTLIHFMELVRNEIIKK